MLASVYWRGSLGPYDNDSFLFPSEISRLQTREALLCGTEVLATHCSTRLSNQIQPRAKLGRKRRYSQCPLWEKQPEGQVPHFSPASSRVSEILRDKLNTLNSVKIQEGTTHPFAFVRYSLHTLG